MQCHVTAVYAVSICNTCDLRQMWLAYYQTFSPPGSCSILVFSHKCSVKFKHGLPRWVCQIEVEKQYMIHI